MRLLLLMVAAFLPLLDAAIAPAEYRERRAALRKALPNGVVLLFGATERASGELRSGFFQEPNFYYLTGWSEPGAILILTPKNEALLIPRRDPDQERWTGPKSAPEDPQVAASTGFESLAAAESFEGRVAKWAEEGAKIYTLRGEPRFDDLKKLLPLREILDVTPAIAKLRMVKSKGEIEAIQRATDVTIDAHTAAWKAMRAGLAEYEVASIMSAVYFGRGCERHAYMPIVGSGPTATILHYSRNRRKIDRGELVLMDVGAECSMYASDITRTVPSTGKFTERQRELYNIVLGAQKAAIAAVKPGALLSKAAPAGPYRAALDYLNAHGGLGKYFTHGIGHHVGLEVHDADNGAPLLPGMVVTIEPGVYIPEEGIGIRIEDMVLVTETGAAIMSSKLPREAADVERALAR